MKKIKKARDSQNFRNDKVATGEKGANIAVIQLTSDLKELFKEIEFLLQDMQKIISNHEKSQVNSLLIQKFDQSNLARKRKIKADLERVLNKMEESEVDINQPIQATDNKFTNYDFDGNFLLQRKSYREYDDA